MKEQPRTEVTHFRYGNFKRKMKRLQLLQKLAYEKFYVHKNYKALKISYFFKVLYFF